MVKKRPRKKSPPAAGHPARWCFGTPRHRARHGAPAAEPVLLIVGSFTINDRPVVVEFIIRTDAMVWPMVAFGASNDEITIARDMAPDWGDVGDDVAPGDEDSNDDEAGKMS